MGDRQYHLKFDSEKAAAVDEYLEYRRIVGDDDAGELFTPEEYDRYKKDVLPMRLENRVYTSWTNSGGMDCKQIGPETPCFCQHRYKQHKTDFKTLPAGRPILLPCRAAGCKCVSYHYIPIVSGGPIRCTCKHVADDHSAVQPYQCKKSICQKCAGFKSSYTCGCGDSYMNHRMVVESKQERESRGHPIGYDTPYQAMGGLTGFSSLADGYMRLDPSGRGAPSEEFLKQEITASDNAFLKANVPTIQAQRKANKDYDHLDEDLVERMSAMKKPGEDDMDFFERRYQERQKSSRAYVTPEWEKMPVRKGSASKSASRRTPAPKSGKK